MKKYLSSVKRLHHVNKHLRKKMLFTFPWKPIQMVHRFRHLQQKNKHKKMMEEDDSFVVEELLLQQSSICFTCNCLSEGDCYLTKKKHSTQYLTITTNLG